MRTAHRGALAYCTGDPQQDTRHFVSLADGVLLIENGRIVAVGPATGPGELAVERLSPDIAVIEHPQALIVPGFVDSHVHYPQVDVIASYGTRLLEWLENYTFPAEMRFADEDHARAVAEIFLDELLRNGTTSALVFSTVHRSATEALFSAAQRRNLRLATGKVLMDRHCPESLQDTATSGYAESRALIERWHGQDRLHYAITPRFAVTSSEAQLALAGRLAAEVPEVLIHTHLAENQAEIDWVRELFPAARSYLDVYARAGLVRERAVFAHCLHLDQGDYEHLAHAGAGMAFCPTSNMFLGSGLFDLARARDHHIPVGLATDVGGGTSFSMLQTMSEAYKVLQLRHQSLDSASALFLATLGAAQTLGIDRHVGSFESGKEADFVVLDHTATPLLARRLAGCDGAAEHLFAHMILGDDRSIRATYVLGTAVHQRPYTAPTT